MFLINIEDLNIFKNELLVEIQNMQENIKPNRFLKSKEVRDLLGGISPAKLQSLRVGGHIPAIDADGMWLYDYNDILDFLESHKIGGKEVRDE